MTEDGTKANDTFLTIVQTAKKLGVRADGYGIPQNLSDGAVDRILIGICMTGQYAQSMGNGYFPNKGRTF